MAKARPLSDFVLAAQGVDLARAAIAELESAREDLAAVAFALGRLYVRFPMGTELSTDLYELLTMTERAGLSMTQRAEDLDVEINRRTP